MSVTPTNALAVRIRANHAPAFVGLPAESQITVGGNINLRAYCVDPDGDITSVALDISSPPLPAGCSLNSPGTLIVGGASPAGSTDLILKGADGRGKFTPPTSWRLTIVSAPAPQPIWNGNPAPNFTQGASQDYAIVPTFVNDI